MAKHDMEPKDDHYYVVREGPGWMVVRDIPGAEPPRPGHHHLVWHLTREDADRGIVAHLQFTDPDFVDNLPGGSRRLDEHWTARLDRNNPDLRLALKPGASNRIIYYAVMITGDGDPHWAIGENPPPKIDVGG